MTWQDELRRLEEDRAGGRVSAAEYRMRRDQLLSSANASPPTDNAMDSTQIIPPVGTGPDDATQVVGNQPAGAVPGPPQADPMEQPTQHTGDRPGGWPPGQGYPQPGGQQFDQPPEDENTPPWAGDRIPPLTAGSSEWVKQGPERASGKGGRGKIIGIAAGVVLLVILGVGAWLLFGQSGTGQHQQGAGGNNTATGAKNAGNHATRKPKPNPLGIITPAGKPEDHSDVHDLAGLEDANYLNPQEEQAYTNAVTSQVTFVVSHKGADTIVLTGAKASSPNEAKKAVQDLHNAELTNAMKKSSIPAAPGVRVDQVHGKPGQPSEIRAHYAHGATIVRVHVSGKDWETVRKDFATTLNEQLRKLPADA